MQDGNGRPASAWNLALRDKREGGRITADSEELSFLCNNCNGRWCLLPDGANTLLLVFFLQRPLNEFHF